MPIGKTLVLWEVTSTAVADRLSALQEFLPNQTANQEFTVLQIQTRKAIDIRAFSAFDRTEGEFILPPGTVISLDSAVNLGTHGVMFSCTDRDMACATVN
jgi:hypothetical protein